MANTHLHKTLSCKILFHCMYFVKAAKPQSTLLTLLIGQTQSNSDHR